MSIFVFFRFILISLTFTFAITQNTQTVYKNGIIQLGTKNFEHEIKIQNVLLVSFCNKINPHCEVVDIQIANAVKILENKISNPPKIGRVDINLHTELRDRFGINVNMIPILKLFVNGQFIEDYYGVRHAVNIASYLRRKSNIPYHLSYDPEDLADHMRHYSAIFVFFGDSSSEDTKVNFDAFGTNSANFEQVEFAICLVEDCLKAFNAERGIIMVFKGYDEKTASLKVYDEFTLKNFIILHSVPHITNFDAKVNEIVFAKQAPAIFFYRDINNSQEIDKYNKILMDLAEKYHVKHNINFIVADLIEPYESRVAEFIGIKASELPTIMLVDPRGDLSKFKYQGDETTEDVEKFILKWLNNELVPFVKTEKVPDPEQEKTSLIKKVVATTFNEMVNKSDKHVLISFYDPYDDISISMSSVWSLLSTHLNQTNSNIELQKFNHPDNEVLLAIMKYPTIKLYLIGKKDEPIDFNSDDYSLTSFEKFLENNVPDFKKFEYKDEDTSVKDEV